MPELPEVETVAKHLSTHATKKRILSIEATDGKLVHASFAALKNRLINAIYRNGKQIVFELDDATFLWIHLRMTGRLFWFENNPGKVDYERLRFNLDGGVIVFSDQRRFGTIKYSATFAEHEAKGIDPLSNKFTAKILFTLISKSKTAIKPWLLHQDKIVGMGNIYASEALFRAKVKPTRSSCSLSFEEAKRLHRAMRQILRKAISYGGTTFINFANPEGSKGGYSKELRVYGREELPCPNCAKRIVRIVQQGRSTYYCPKCQH